MKSVIIELDALPYMDKTGHPGQYLQSRRPGSTRCAVAVIADVAICHGHMSSVLITGLANPKPNGHGAYTQRVCSHTWGL